MCLPGGHWISGRISTLPGCDATLPPMPQVEAADGFATEFFTNANAVLGGGAYVTAAASSITIRVGSRRPFGLTDEDLALEIAPSSPLVLQASGRQVTGTIMLQLPQQPDTPLPALVEQQGTLALPCGDDAQGGSKGATIKIRTRKGEVWADVEWAVVAAPPDVLEQLQAEVTRINSLESVMDRMVLREAGAAWPEGEYALAATVYNLAGASSTTNLSFRRQGVALPSIDLGVNAVEFRRSEGLEMNPVGGAAGCSSGVMKYMWRSMGEEVPAFHGESQTLRIPPDAMWVKPGRTYPFIFSAEVSVCLDQEWAPSGLHVSKSCECEMANTNPDLIKILQESVESVLTVMGYHFCCRMTKARSL